MKLYIDCDPGVDDILALGYLLTRPNLEIVGIGTVSGNLSLEKVSRNLQLIVSLLQPNINIFKGSENFIIEYHGIEADFYHGTDGIGEFWNSEYYSNNKDEIDNIAKRTSFSDKSAVIELIDLSIKYEGQLVILALGPLTNIALAELVDPQFSSRVKDIRIMGGNYKNHGNSNVYIGAEYNFSKDPESAHIVLNRMKCPKYIYPLDCSGNPSMNKKLFNQWNTNEIFGKLVEICLDFMDAMNVEYTLYDLNLAVILMHPEVIARVETRNVAIELMSDLSRGNLITDIERVINPNGTVGKRFSTVLIIEELDQMKMIDLIQKF